MKKILFSLLMLCCMTTAWAEDAGSGFIEVSTPDGLKKAIQQNNSANIKLVADIDISNLGTICDTFKGHIYGKYQYTNKVGELRDTVYSLKGGGKEIPRIFNKLDHANIEYIMLDDFTVKEKGDVVGALAGTASYTNFNYMMTNKVVVSSKDDNVGGLVGNADHCRFEGVSINYSSVRSDETIVGGMVGESHQCTFSNCVTNRSTVFADGALASNYARVGGLSGYSVGDTFTNCVNTSVVGGNEDSVGGFAGRSDGSTFMGCTNSGVIIHANEADFNQVVENVKKMYEDQSTLSEAVIQTAFLFGLFGGAGLAAGHIICLGSLGFGFLPIFGAFCGAILVAAGIATYVAWLTTLHDEIGGICGQANSSEFSLCLNSGFINCKDSQGGGIVGRANGVTVDNCLNDNQCKWGDDDCGGIIGGATGGCKVTNCLNNFDSPIIGEAENMNSASGNNYRLQGGKKSNVPDLEREVNKQLLHYGLVASWLNNGVENREKGIRPWHQNLWAREGSDGEEIARDMYPVLIASHDEVNADLFYDATYSNIVYRIHDADGLKAFADLVNSGTSTDDYQFRVACLENDINMEGVDWTPIGKDEDYKNFRGIFNGRGHKITGLTCSSTNQPVGLIGTAFANAVICNVTIGEGSSFTCGGDAGAGGIVGKVKIRGRDWGTVVIENCGSHANVNGFKHVGGILGNVDTPDNNSTIKVYVNNCYSTGTVTAEHGNSALLCGYMKNNGVVSNSWSSGQLRNGENKGIWPYSWENNDKVAECLVGYFDNRFDIKNCYIVNPEANVDRYNDKPLQSGVTVCTSDELAIGRMTYLLNRSNALKNKELIWQQNVGNDDIPSLGNKGNYHTRDRKAGSRYGTVCLPFPVQSNDKITYYIHWGDRDITDSEGVKLQFEYYEKPISSGDAVLYRVNDDSSTICFDCADHGTFGPEPANARGMYDWSMFGTYNEQKVFTYETNPSSKEIYYLSGDEIKNAKNTTIAPYRGYFVGPSIDELTGNGANQAMTIRFEIEGEGGETTALELVGDDLVPMQNGKAYSIMGTEVGNGYRGIVIENGKKVVRK